MHGVVVSNPVARNIESALISDTTESQLIQRVARGLDGERAKHLLQALKVLLGAFAGPVARDDGLQADSEAFESRLNLQWRALIVIEHLFLHVKPFRVYLLSHIHRFLKLTLLGHDLIRNRSLITIGRFAEKCRGQPEYKLVEFLPRYIKNQYKLHLVDDPRVIRKQQLSLQLSRIADEFRSKTDYASDLLYELDQCVSILVPDPNRSVAGCLIPESNVNSKVVDDFENDSGTDSYVSCSDESLDDEYLEWEPNRNYNNERYGSYSMELRLHRSMEKQVSDDNFPLIDMIRGSYRELLKTISPELQNWKTVLQCARDSAKSEQSKEIFWNRSIQVRYGFVTSLCLRVEEAIWRCEILLGLV